MNNQTNENSFGMRFRSGAEKMMTGLAQPQLILFMSFLLPVVIMLSLFIVRSIFPFGDRSFLFSDMYHQYMPFFAEFMRKIKAGEGLAYSYRVGIGSNFLALYVYYLASPFHWLAFLLPEAYLMEFMSYLAVLKIGFAGLTCCCYLQKHFERTDFGMLFFACFYALSGYMAAYNWNIMWLDCVVLLPLIVLGLELLVKEGRCTLYCITLALSIFTNYYISIMICMFLVIYFVFQLLTVRFSWKAVGNFALYSLLAGGMAAILLVPEVCAILATDFGDISFPEQIESYFPVLDVLARHGFCVAAERGLDHWPNIYCGVAVFVLIPLYAVNTGVPARRRFGMLAMAGILLLGFSTNVLDFIWHGLNYPDSLPGRQAFLYIFLVLVMCYEAYLHISEVTAKEIVQAYLAAVVFLLFCEKFVEEEAFFVGIEMLTLTVVSCYAVLLYCYRTGKGKRCLLAGLALVLVIAESSIHTGYTSVGTVSRSGYLDELSDYRALYQYVKEQDDTFFRVEKFTRKTKNDGTLAGYPTASVFSSTMNSSVMDLYKRLGMRHSKVYYGYDGATALTSALLNVKYMFGESEHYAGPLYDYLEKSGDVHLYESKYTLPFGYVAPTGFDLPEEGGNGVRLQNRLVRSLGVEDNLLTEVAGRKTAENVIFSADEDGIYYAKVEASGTSKIEVIGGVHESRLFNDLKVDNLIYLGSMYAGDTVTMTNGDDKDDTPKIAVSVYRLNESALQEALDVLSAQHMTDVVYDSTHISGTVELTQPGRVIWSVPYESGWTLTVNGEETEPQLFGACFMALDLEPGTYTIDMAYAPTGRTEGILITIASLLIFGGIGMWKRKAKDKKKKEQPDEDSETDASEVTCV